MARRIVYSSSAGQLIHPEFEWEQWFGDAGQRASRSGKRALRLRRYLADELERAREGIRSGYAAKRSAREERRAEHSRDRQRVRERTRHVAEMGRQSYKLRGVPQLPVSFERALYASVKRSGMGKSSEDQSSAQIEGGSEEEPESSDDEDWDTTSWSQEEIECAVDTLVEEIRSSTSAKKRRVATRMLEKLLRKHKWALEHMDLIVPTLAEKALFSSPGGIRRSVESTRLAHMLANIAPLLAEKLSRYACATKATRLLSRKFVLAARMLQCSWRWHRFEKRLAKTVDVEARLRRRLMFSITLKDLTAQWRRFVHQAVGELSLREKVSNLRFLGALCSKSNRAFYRKDRRVVVEHGGLLPVQELCFSHEPGVRRVSLSLLAKLAEEESLRLPMLQNGVLVTLCAVLQSELLEDRCLALEVLDLLLGCACDRDPVLLESTWAEVHDPEASLGEGPLCTSEGAWRDTGIPQVFAELAPECAPPRETVFMRAQDPVLRVADSVALLVDRRRDGGLLRRLRSLLQSDDAILRLGSTLCLLRLASSAANPRIVCCGERMTIHETRIKPSEPSYDALRRERVQQVAHALIHNLADLETPGLSVASLQVIAQLLACAKSRHVLLEASFAELVLMNMCYEPPFVPLGGTETSASNEAVRRKLRTRGLLVLVLASGSTSRPLWDSVVDKDLGGGDAGTQARLYQLVLQLESEPTERQVDQCLRAALLALLWQRPAEAAHASLRRLCFELRGLQPLLRFLLGAEPEGADGVDGIDLGTHSCERCEGPATGASRHCLNLVADAQGDVPTAVEHLSIAGIVLGRLTDMLPETSEQLCTDQAVGQLLEVLHVAHAPPAALAVELARLLAAGAEASCQALASIARVRGSDTARWMVANTLLRRQSLQILVSLVARGSKARGSDADAAAQIAARAASLIGALVPYLGLELEALTDLVSEPYVATESEVLQAEAIAQGEDSADGGTPSAATLRKRAESNARKAADQGVSSSGSEDLTSSFGSAQLTEMVGLIVDTASARLVRALQRCRSQSGSECSDGATDTALGRLAASTCYALSRLCATRGMSRRVREQTTVIEAVCLMLAPAQDDNASSSEESDDNNDAGRRGRRRRKRSRAATTRGGGITAQLASQSGGEDGRIVPSVVFTLCAAIARTLPGKLQMLECGAVQRAVDSFSTSSRDPELIKTQGEAALLIARVANVQHPTHGTANRKLLVLPGAGFRALFDLAAASAAPARARLHALLALAQLAQDSYVVMPKLVKVGGLEAIADILKDLEGSRATKAAGGPAEALVNPAAALARQALRVLFAMSKYMVSKNHDQLLRAGVEPVLQRLASMSEKEGRSSREGARRVTGSGARTHTDPLAAQPTVSEMASAVLSDLRLSIAYGSEVSRQVATAPQEAERPLTAAIATSDELAEDRQRFARDPFGQRALQVSLFSVAKSELTTLLPPPCSAQGRMETREMRPAGRRRDRKASAAGAAAGTAAGAEAAQHHGHGASPRRQRRRRRAKSSRVGKQPGAKERDVDGDSLRESSPASLAARLEVGDPSAAQSASCFRGGKPPRLTPPRPGPQAELAFSNCLPVLALRPEDLLWTRPQGRPKAAPAELQRMHEAFLLSTRPSKRPGAE